MNLKRTSNENFNLPKLLIATIVLGLLATVIYWRPDTQPTPISPSEEASNTVTATFKASEDMTQFILEKAENREAFIYPIDCLSRKVTRKKCPK